MISQYDNAMPVEWGHALRVPNYDWYLATNRGLIISTKYKKPRTLKPGKKPNGRLTVNLWANGETSTEYVHRLVALAFHGQPKKGQEVNHIDGNPQNNTPENLEWCTRSYNQQHAFRTGLNTGHKGEENFNSKLTEDDVRQVRALRGTLSQQQLADNFGVSKSAIKHIQMNRVWKHLAEDPVAYLGDNL